jgi:hypothetical protein
MKLPEEMTLTDFFAAFALAGMISNQNEMDIYEGDISDICCRAYLIGIEMAKNKESNDER